MMAVSNDVLEIWNQAVSYLNQRNTKEYLGVYLGCLTPEILSDSELVVSTSNSFVKNRIERDHFFDIKDAIFNVAGIDYGFRVVFSGSGGAQAPAPRQTAPKTSDSLFMYGDTPGTTGTPPLPPNNTPAFPYPTTTGEPHLGMNREQGEFYPDTPAPSPHSSFALPTEIPEPNPAVITDACTFESFIVGDSNRYAWSTALAVAKSPGNIYNPLFIYGESGLGKTHLLLAIQDYIKTNQPHLRTTYADASDLVREFTAMLYDSSKKREFELKYHRADVVLFDDVQSLAGKVETTNEVFQIFNHFIAQDKQIVLCADRAPKDIDLDARYKSRFASGITSDIQPPTFETKRAIFENFFDYCCRKIERPDIKEIVGREIIDRIIELSTDNIRELEGATASLVAYLSARDNMFHTLTIEEVEERISSVFMRTEGKRVTIGSIQKEVENFYKISHEDLIGKKRSQGITYPRQIAMYLARSMTGESYPDIGRAFGGKDHTTPMYAYNKIEQKRQLSKETNREIERLVALLKQ
jgi:chromosomal replication initiator protein